MELNHLQHIPMGSLRNRLMLLHHFSELVCSSLPLFDLQPRSREHVEQEPFVALDALRAVLIPSGKVRDYACLFLRQVILHSSLSLSLSVSPPPSLLEFLLPFPAQPSFTHQPPSPPGLSSTTLILVHRRSKFKLHSMILFVCVFLLLQEAAFRKVVQATMVRDRQHGPVIELNRIQVKRRKLHLRTISEFVNCL